MNFFNSIREKLDSLMSRQHFSHENSDSNRGATMFLYQLVCLCLLVFGCLHLVSAYGMVNADDRLVMLDQTPSRVVGNARKCLMPGELSKEMWYNWGTISIYPTGHLLQKHHTGKMYRVISQRFEELYRGTEIDCRDYVINEKLVPQKAEFSKHVVILVHGLYAPGWCMRHLQNSLNTPERQAIMVDYPSSRVSLEECANYLKKALSTLEGVERIDLVCHSMGGIVARKYLMENKDERVKNLVTIGTPHKGAELATLFYKWPMFEKVIGPAAKELATYEESPVTKITFPDIPLGVIAGGTGLQRGYNPLIKGDNDGTVSVSSTRIEEATDYMQVKALHHTLLKMPEVLSAVDQFLKTQHFQAMAEMR